MVIHCTFNTNDIFVRVDFKTSSVREGRLEMAYIAFLHDVSASVLVSRANPLGIETTRDLLALRTKCLIFRFQWLTHLKKKKEMFVNRYLPSCFVRKDLYGRWSRDFIAQKSPHPPPSPPSAYLIFKDRI